MSWTNFVANASLSSGCKLYRIWSSLIACGDSGGGSGGRQTSSSISRGDSGGGSGGGQMSLLMSLSAPNRTILLAVSFAAASRMVLCMGMIPSNVSKGIAPSHSSATASSLASGQHSQHICSSSVWPKISRRSMYTFITRRGFQLGLPSSSCQRCSHLKSSLSFVLSKISSCTYPERWPLQAYRS